MEYFRSKKVQMKEFCAFLRYMGCSGVNGEVVEMNIVTGLSTSEVWFYSGIIIMIFAVLFSLISIVVLTLSKWKIKSQLEKEYGPEMKK